MAGRALEILTQMDYRGPELLDAALKRLKESPDAKVHGEYLMSELLTEFEPAPQKVLPILEPLLRKKPNEISLLMALARHKPDHPLLVPSLLRVLESEMKGWHGLAFEILYRSEVPKSAEALALFRKILKDKDSSIFERQRAALALASTGARDAEILEALVRFYDPKPEIMEIAKKALVEFPFSRNPSIFSALIENIYYESPLASASRELLIQWHRQHDEVESFIRESFKTDKSKPEIRMDLLAAMIPRQRETFEFLTRIIDSPHSNALQPLAAKALENAGRSSTRTQELILKSIDCGETLRKLSSP